MCSEGAAGQGAAGGAGVLRRCLRHGTTARASRLPDALHGEGEVCSLQSQKSGGFLHRGKAERAGVCNLLPAAALSPVRRWSHSLDPTRISGKQKSCCSPFSYREEGDGRWTPKAWRFAQSPLSSPGTAQHPSGPPSAAASMESPAGWTCESAPPAPQIQTNPMTAARPSCWQ